LFCSPAPHARCCLYRRKCKLYRYDNDAGEWKERGVGQGRILLHKENKKIRFLMRQDKTLKIRGNHIIMPGTKVQEHGGSDKAMVWSCVDFADESQRMELFCIRFASAERAQQFQAAYHDAASKMEELIGSPGFAEEVGGGGAAPSRVGEAGGTAGGRRATVLAEGGQTGAMSGSTTHFTAGLGAACGPACRQLAVPGRGGQGRLPMPQLRPCSRQGSWSCRPQSVAQPLFLRMHSRQPCLPAPCLNNR
jgi:hypothetical protein